MGPEIKPTFNLRCLFTHLSGETAARRIIFAALHAPEGIDLPTVEGLGYNIHPDLQKTPEELKSAANNPLEDDVLGAQGNKLFVTPEAKKAIEAIGKLISSF